MVRLEHVNFDYDAQAEAASLDRYKVGEHYDVLDVFDDSQRRECRKWRKAEVRSTPLLTACLPAWRPPASSLPL